MTKEIKNIFQRGAKNERNRNFTFFIASQFFQWGAIAPPRGPRNPSGRPWCYKITRRRSPDSHLTNSSARRLLSPSVLPSVGGCNESEKPSGVKSCHLPCAVANSECRNTQDLCICKRGYDPIYRNGQLVSCQGLFVYGGEANNQQGTSNMAFYRPCEYRTYRL